LGLSLFERADGFVLLRFCELRKRLAIGLAAMRFERRKSMAIELLLVGVGTREREIDVIEHIRVRRARLARSARHKALGKGGDGRSVACVEERALPRSVRERIHASFRLGPGLGARDERGGRDGTR